MEYRGQEHMPGSYEEPPSYASSQHDVSGSVLQRPDIRTPFSSSTNDSVHTVRSPRQNHSLSPALADKQSNLESRGAAGREHRPQTRSYRAPSCESYDEDDDRLTDVYVAVMGVTGAGKSSFIEKLTGKDINVGHGLMSCTADVEEFTFVYEGRYRVHLIDTPGFDDTKRRDIDVLKDISGWLGSAYANDIKLSGIIYLHRITDVRMTGTARKNLFMFKKLCGPECFHKVCLVTTMWENVDERTGNKREEQLIDTEDFWGFMTRNGSKIERHMNTRESAMSILRTLVKHKSDIVLDIQKELGEGIRLDDTGAGRQLNEEIHKLQEEHKKELEFLEKEKLDALRRKDNESVEQIEELQRENARKLAQMAQDRESIKVDMARILQEREQQLRELDERNARYDQLMREKEEMYEMLMAQQAKGAANSGQNARIEALGSQIHKMHKVSREQHKNADKKRAWLEKSLAWVKKHRKGIGQFAVLGAKIGLAVF